MIVARWCHRHRLVLEESWQGLRCPAGHDWFAPQSLSQGGYWVVDMEYEPSDIHFCIWIVERDGVLKQGAWYKQQAQDDMDATSRPDYVNQPEHWAKTRKLGGHQWNFIQRMYRGKV